MRKKVSLRINILFFVFGIFTLCSVHVSGAVVADIDGSGTVELKDAVAALQVCAGMEPSVKINADVSGDGKIGLEEAVFVLQAVTNIIDSTTMYGKFIAGYQGWFSCPGDSSKISDTWGHWFNWNTAPDAVNLKVDMWPDISELDEDELFSTNMKMSDRTRQNCFPLIKRKPCCVISDGCRNTVLTAFFYSGLLSDFMIRAPDFIMMRIRRSLISADR